MNKESMYEQIDQYLNNELKGVELKAFERQLKEDENLAKEVALIRDMEEAIEDRYLDTQFAPKLREMSKDYFKEDNTKILSNTTTSTNTTRKATSSNHLAIILLIASIIVGVLLWKYFMATPNQETTPEVKTEQIFAANFQPYTVDNLQRSGTTTASDYQAAIEAYQVKDYAKAIPILEKALIDMPDDNDIKILLGNSYLSAKPINGPAAIQLLKPISEDEMNLYQEEAQWYLALAYLQNNELETARVLLQELANKQIGKYPKLAKAILEQL